MRTVRGSSLTTVYITNIFAFFFRSTQTDGIDAYGTYQHGNLFIVISDPWSAAKAGHQGRVFQGEISQL